MTTGITPAILLGGGASGSASDPLRDFYEARAVRWAKLASAAGAFARDSSRGSGLTRGSTHTAAQKQGLRFERKLHDRLSARFGNAYEHNVWFDFCDSTGRRRCSPDGLLHLSDGVVIIEAKTFTVAKAWYQLRRLYEPVVRKALQPQAVSLLLIPKQHDPSVVLPEEYKLLEDMPEKVIDGMFGVLPWTLLNL